MNNARLFFILCLVLPAASQAYENEQIINQTWYDTFPVSFCKRNLDVDTCLTRVSEYVALKHIMANDDYYRAEIKRRSMQRLKEKALDVTNPYNPNDVKNAERESRMEVISKVASDWLKTGELPSVDRNSK